MFLFTTNLCSFGETETLQTYCEKTINSLNINMMQFINDSF